MQSGIAKNLSPRIKIFQTVRGITIEIPPKRALPYVMFQSIWLCVWTFLQYMFLSDFVQNNERPAGISMWAYAAFTALGIYALFVWLKMMFCQETVIFDDTTLTVRREIFGMDRARRYPLNEMRELRVLPLEVNPSLYLPWNYEGMAQGAGISHGILAFTFKGKIVRFGLGLDDYNASLLVELITARYSDLKERRKI